MNKQKYEKQNNAYLQIVVEYILSEFQHKIIQEKVNFITTRKQGKQLYYSQNHYDLNEINRNFNTTF
jgi:hypothetical protein